MADSEAVADPSGVALEEHPAASVHGDPEAMFPENKIWLKVTVEKAIMPAIVQNLSWFEKLSKVVPALTCTIPLEETGRFSVQLGCEGAEPKKTEQKGRKNLDPADPKRQMVEWKEVLEFHVKEGDLSIVVELEDVSETGTTAAQHSTIQSQLGYATARPEASLQSQGASVQPQQIGVLLLNKADMEKAHYHTQDKKIGEGEIEIHLKIDAFVSEGRGCSCQMECLALETPFERACRLDSTIPYAHVGNFAWAEPAFVGQFGDAFGVRGAGGLGSDGCSRCADGLLRAARAMLPLRLPPEPVPSDAGGVEPATPQPARAPVPQDARRLELKELFTDTQHANQQADASPPSAGEVEKKVQRVLEAVHSAKKLAEELAQMAKPRDSDRALGEFVQKRAEEVYKLAQEQPSDVLLIWPGGWVHAAGQRCCYHVLFRSELADSGPPLLSFVTCNGGKGLDYHEASPLVDQDKKFTSHMVAGIPPERIGDRAFLWALFKCQVAEFGGMDGEVLYEFLLPHLGCCSLRATPQTQDRSARPEKLSRIDSSCSQPYRSLVSTVRYCLRQQRLPSAVVKNFMLALRLSYLRAARANLEDLARGPADTRAKHAVRMLPHGVQDSDRRMLQIACQQAALAAVRASTEGRISVHHLGLVKAEVKDTSALVWRAQSAACGLLPPAAPPAEDMAAEAAGVDRCGWCSWPELKMILSSAGETLESFEGPARPVRHAAAVDQLQVPAQPLGAGASNKEVLAVLAAVEGAVAAQRNTASDRLGMLQVATQIEHAFLVVLPAPAFHGPCSWSAGEASARAEMLQRLDALSHEYSAATRSVPFHPDMAAPRLLTHLAIMAAYFQTLRSRPPGLSAHDDVLPLLIEEQHLAFSADPATHNADTLLEVLRRLAVVTPELAQARHRLLSFIADMRAWALGPDGRPKVVFDMPFNNRSSYFKSGQVLTNFMRDLLMRGAEPVSGLVEEEEEEEEPVATKGGSGGSAQPQDADKAGGADEVAEARMQCGEAETEQAGLKQAAAPKKKVTKIAMPVTLQNDFKNEQEYAIRNKREPPPEPSEFRRLAYWLALTWVVPSPWQLLRNMLARYWLGVQYTRPNERSGSDGAPLTQDSAKAGWSLRSQDSYMTSACLELSCRHNVLENRRYPYTQADPRFYLQKMFPFPPNDNVEATQDHILAAESLQLGPFWKTMVEEDVEELLSLLSAPALRIPLVLEFFLAERVALFQHRSLLDLFSAAIFEAGHWASTSPFPTSPDQQLYPPTQPLGTPLGALATELERAPAGVLQPLLQLLRKMVGLCTGSSRSRFREAFLGLLRLAVRVRAFALAELERPGPDGRAQAGELARLTEELGEFLSAAGESGEADAPRSALTVVERWLGLEEKKESRERDVELQCALHAHRLLLLQPCAARSHVAAGLAGRGAAEVGALLQSAVTVRLRFLATAEGEAKELCGLCEQELFWLWRRAALAALDSWLRAATRRQIETALSQVLLVLREGGGAGWTLAVQRKGEEWEAAGEAVAAESLPYADAARVVECVAVLAREGEAPAEEFHLDLHACRLWQSRTVAAPVPDSFKACAGFKYHSQDMGRFCTHTQTENCETIKMDRKVGTRNVSMTFQLWRAFSQYSAKRITDTPGNPREKGRGNPELGWHFAGVDYGGTVQNGNRAEKREYVPFARATDTNVNPDDVPGWLGAILDPVLQGAVMKAAADSSQPGLFKFEIPSEFRCNYLLPRTRIPADAPEVTLLFSFLNSWKVLRVSRTFHAVSVSTIDSFGRRGFLRQIYCSDVRFSVAALRANADAPNPTPLPAPSAIQFQAGTLARASLGGADLLVRKREWEDNAEGERVEMFFVPASLLAGQLPAALTEVFIFWQHTEGKRKGCLDGSPWIRNAFFRYQLKVAAEEGGAAGQDRIRVLRREADGQQQRQLVNLNRIPIGSAYHDLLLLLVRLDDLSHILAWTKQFAVPQPDHSQADKDPAQHADAAEEEHAQPGPLIDLIELPRLRLRFAVRRAPSGGVCSDRGGRLRLESLDRVGMAVLAGQREVPAALTAGLPAALLLASDAGTLALLIPNCPRARVAPLACPLGAESQPLPANEAWQRACGELRAFFYEVHVSKAFVAFPSLASALYWTYCKLLHREYAAAAESALFCSTDMPLSDAELCILRFFGADAVRLDDAPDAIACRLRLRSCLQECPDVDSGRLSLDAVFGPLAPSVERYVSSSRHVAAACRFSPAEELALLRQSGSSIPRVHNRKKLLDSDLVRAVSTSSSAYPLHGFVSPVKIQDCARLQQPDSTSFWNSAVDNALSPLPEAWRVSCISSKAQPKSLSEVWDCAKDDASCYGGRGYIYIAQLLAGHSTVLPAAFTRLSGDPPADAWAGEVAHSFGAMAVRLRLLRYGDNLFQVQHRLPWSLLIRGCALPAEMRKLPALAWQGPDSWLPNYDNRSDQEKADNRVLESSLIDWIAAHRPLVDSEAARAAFGQSKWRVWSGEAANDGREAETKRQLRLHVDVQVADYGLDRRELAPFAFPFASLSARDASAYATRPLEAAGNLDLDEFLQTRRPAENQQLGPFPVPHIWHNEALRDIEAKGNIWRLNDAWKVYGESLKKGTETYLAGITPELLDMADSEMAVEPENVRRVQLLFQRVSLEHLNELRQALQNAAEIEQAKLQCEIDCTRRFASSSLPRDTRRDPQERAGLEEREAAPLQYELRQFCGLEPTIPIQHLIAASVSKNSCLDMQRLNPFLTDQDAKELLQGVVGIMLRSIRISQLRRAIDTAIKAAKAVDLTEAMERARRAEQQTNSIAGTQPGQKDLLNKAQAVEYVRTVRKETTNLSAELGSTRHIFRALKPADAASSSSPDNASSNPADNAPSDKPSDTASQQPCYEFDPRYLLFEFLFGWLLSSKQVDITRKFQEKACGSGSANTDGDGAQDVAAASRTWNQCREWEQHSMVHQMIMGAGKTTCIGPLLCLILADRKSLVTQVVPGALLAMSRNVLWSRFTHIIPKRIFTFEFSRSSAANQDAMDKLLRKLKGAKKRGDIVVTTPAAIKSVINRFVELERKFLAGNGSEQVQRTLAKVLNLWSERKKGVLILDEVDMLLHPLRSELNFPIGDDATLIEPHPERWSFPMFVFQGLFWAISRAGGDHHLASEDDPNEHFHLASEDDPNVHWRGTSSPAPQCLHDLKAKIELGYEQKKLQKRPHLVLLDEAWYHEHMMPLLALWALEWMQNVALLFAAPSPASVGKSSVSCLQKLIEKADPKQHTQPDELECPIVQYLQKGKRCSENANNLLCDKKLEDEMGPERRKRLIQLLNLGHDLLVSYLPHAISKVYRVSFGLLLKSDLAVIGQDQPRSRKLLAVPFVGKDTPSPAAEFAQADVLIAMTILAYHYCGLRPDDLADLVARYKHNVAAEPGDRIEVRKTFMLFKQLVLQQAGSLLEQNKEKESVKEPFVFTTNHEELAAREDSFLEQWKNCRKKPEHLRLLANLELISTADKQDMADLHKLLRRSSTAAVDLLHAVFLDTMKLHPDKISSSAQELGSGIIFGRRLGFSGTPSSLLPDGFGECKFDEESEGKILHTLTSPDIVNESPLSSSLREEKASAWTPHGILDSIAEPNEKESKVRYHALIDTGALITGLSNEGVARYLLEGRPEADRKKEARRRMEGFDAVVFLDARDARMVIKRDAAAAIPLSEYGGSVDRIFTFFDQVHTTGMDIKQALDARALLTVGKDMTFRDYAQGGYRMRGIGKGQTLDLYLVPEMWELIKNALKLPAEPRADSAERGQSRVGQGSEGADITTVDTATVAGRGGEDSSGYEAQSEEGVRGDGRQAQLQVAGSAETAATKKHDIVCTVVEWLLVNGLKTERLQFQQLQMQNLGTVWRGRALSQLLRRRLPGPHRPSCSSSSCSGCESIPLQLELEQEGRWTQERCLKIWVDSVSLGLQGDLGTQDSFEERLQAINREYANKLLDAASREEVDNALGSVMTADQLTRSKQIVGRFSNPQSQKDADGATKLGSEMTREKEREQTQEKQEERPPPDNNQPLRCLRPQRPWGLADVRCFAQAALADAPPLAAAAAAAKAMQAEAPVWLSLGELWTVEKEHLQQPLPRTVAQSANFAPEIAERGRLKSVVMVLDWVPAPATLPEQRVFLALSLAEAEAVRALIEACACGHCDVGDAAMALLHLPANKVVAQTPNYGDWATRRGFQGPSLQSYLEHFGGGLTAVEKEQLFAIDEQELSVANKDAAVDRALGLAGASLRFFNNDMFPSEVQNMLLLQETELRSENPNLGLEAQAKRLQELAGSRLQFFSKALARRRKHRSATMIDHSTIRWLFKPEYQQQGMLAEVVKLKRRIVLQVLGTGSEDARKKLPNEFDKADAAGEDARRDGQITKEELGEYLKKQLDHGADQLDDARLSGLVRYMDTNNDGFIDKSEFINMFTLRK